MGKGRNLGIAAEVEGGAGGVPPSITAFCFNVSSDGFHDDTDMQKKKKSKILCSLSILVLRY